MEEGRSQGDFQATETMIECGIRVQASRPRPSRFPVQGTKPAGLPAASAPSSREEKRKLVYSSEPSPKRGKPPLMGTYAHENEILRTEIVVDESCTKPQTDSTQHEQDYSMPGTFTEALCCRHVAGQRPSCQPGEVVPYEPDTAAFGLDGSVASPKVWKQRDPVSVQILRHAVTPGTRCSVNDAKDEKVVGSKTHRIPPAPISSGLPIADSLVNGQGQGGSLLAYGIYFKELGKAMAVVDCRDETHIDKLSALTGMCACRLHATPPVKGQQILSLDGQKASHGRIGQSHETAATCTVDTCAAGMGPFSVVFHLSPREMLQNVRYKDWMDTFGSDVRQVSAHGGWPQRGFLGATRMQVKLNLVDPLTFPLPPDMSFWEPAATDTFREPELAKASVKGQPGAQQLGTDPGAINGLSMESPIVAGRLLMKVVMQSVVGGENRLPRLDLASCPEEVDVDAIQAELMAGQPWAVGGPNLPFGNGAAPGDKAPLPHEQQQQQQHAKKDGQDHGGHAERGSKDVAPSDHDSPGPLMSLNKKLAGELRNKLKKEKAARSSALAMPGHPSVQPVSLGRAASPLAGGDQTASRGLKGQPLVPRHCASMAYKDPEFRSALRQQPFAGPSSSAAVQSRWLLHSSSNAGQGSPNLPSHGTSSQGDWRTPSVVQGPQFRDAHLKYVRSTLPGQFQSLQYRPHPQGANRRSSCPPWQHDTDSNFGYLPPERGNCQDPPFPASHQLQIPIAGSVRATCQSEHPHPSACLQRDLGLRQTEDPGAFIITFLGTSAAGPSKYRGSSGILLQIPEVSLGPVQRQDPGGNLRPGPAAILLDAGEGVVGQLRLRLGAATADSLIASLACLWVSHKHADHTLGSIAVLSARPPDSTPLLVIGPAALEAWLGEAAAALRSSGAVVAPYMFLLCECAMSDRGPGSPLLTGLMRNLLLSRFESVRMDHCHDAWGLVIAAHSGWSLAFSGDSRPSFRFACVARGVTVLIHEATFEDPLQEKAKKKKHSTVGEALSVAARVRPWLTVLTHFSQRNPKVVELEEGVRRGVCIAFDGMVIAASRLSQIGKLFLRIRTALEPPSNDGVPGIDHHPKGNDKQAGFPSEFAVERLTTPTSRAMI